MPAIDDHTPVGALPVIQMVIALAVVLALVKWVLPPLVKRNARKFKQSSGSGIRVEEFATVGPANLSVVTVRGRSLLIGATADHVSLLADLSDKESGSRETREQGKKADLLSFEELMALAEPFPSSPMPDAPCPMPEPDPLTELARQLERLKRIER